jgi:hypothetical protein
VHIGFFITSKVRTPTAQWVSQRLAIRTWFLVGRHARHTVVIFVDRNHKRDTLAV